MADDSCLRQNPQYLHLFEHKESAPKPEVRWLKPFISSDGMVLRNSECSRFQVRKHGEPAQYDLYSVRVLPFARLIKSGFTTFDDVVSFLRRGEA